ncbi:hypothetical protein PVK06_007750 [Gossypium arboreum]|uniref:SWIM-type domain-containing protein n=1 Tax=Gossypium arboreum TaxID=29729 RepID=A0ABR0QJ35_GOSAR|nr:hypothetical protein PVK06_007750 [Gossypium arboreum]
MHNVDLSQDDALEFQDLPHRRHDRTSSSLDSGELEVGVSQDHPKMDSDMLATLILPTVKADPRTSVPVLIANIHSQLRYIPSYRKAWIAKQKALEKMHGYEISKDHFHKMLAVLRLVNEEGANYLYNIPFKQWTQVYEDGLQYGQMTSNLAECINSILKGTRYLPITSVLRETFFRLAGLFPKTCDCGKFDALRYPCAHIIAACQNLRLDPMSYVDEVYKLETMYNMWRHVFPPVPGERNWLPVSLAPFKLLPDRELRRKPKG